MDVIFSFWRWTTMPRSTRKQSKTGVYHIIIRGINKQDIFQDDEDKKVYLDRLSRYKNESVFELYAYCLMRNHIHLLVKEVDESISGIMKRIGTSYVYWYNNKYDRVGHLFQDRFKSETIEDDAYLLAVVRYIHQNPVKVGSSIEDWTSYSDYFKGHGLTDTKFIMSFFGDDIMKQREAFITYMNEDNTTESMEYENQQRLTDEEAKMCVMKIGCVQYCQEIQNFDKQSRNIVLKKLKDEGLSIRQLEKLTGINRGIIQKV